MLSAVGTFREWFQRGADLLRHRLKKQVCPWTGHLITETVTLSAQNFVGLNGGMITRGIFVVVLRQGLSIYEVVLELEIKTSLVSNSQRTACLFLLSYSGSKGMHHYAPWIFF